MNSNKNPENELVEQITAKLLDIKCMFCPSGEPGLWPARPCSGPRPYKDVIDEKGNCHCCNFCRDICRER